MQCQIAISWLAFGALVLVEGKGAKGSLRKFVEVGEWAKTQHHEVRRWAGFPHHRLTFRGSRATREGRDIGERKIAARLTNR